MATDLNFDTEIAATKTASTGTALGFLNEALHLLDKAFRRTRNPFGSAALLNTGTTEGTVPLIGSGGKLPSSVLPTNIPAASVRASGASSKFKVSQIPTVYANQTTGVFAKARFANLPATKLNRSDGPLPLSKLPASYTTAQTWPTRYGPGGPGVQDADGTTIGTTAGFVASVRPTRPGESEGETHRVQGTPSANGTLRLQILSQYVRDGATAGAGTDWRNGPPAEFLPQPTPGNGNGNGNGNGEIPPPGDGQGQPDNGPGPPPG